MLDSPRYANADPAPITLKSLSLAKITRTIILLGFKIYIFFEPIRLITVPSLNTTERLPFE